MAGEVVAPILFGAVAAFPSLAPAFLLGALSYAPAALLPLLITAPGHADGATATPAKGGAAAVASLVEGVRYILNHPLLPGLYALDWGMTLCAAPAHTTPADCVHAPSTDPSSHCRLSPGLPCRPPDRGSFTFYRELFPFLVATLFTQAHLGLSARQAAAALTIANYVGGTLGSSITLFFNSYAYKGRAVCYATLAYGLSAGLIGSTPLLPVGMAFVSLCGATDAVGMTFRKTVVLCTTPDHLRGRAQAGHSLAANVANALGQMYVAAMGTLVGPPATMALGGALTWAAVALAVWRIPKLWRDASGASGSASDSADASQPAAAVEAAEAPPPPATMERCESRGKSRLLPETVRSDQQS
eukprot:3606851-Prymnesium_polylepis.1